MALASSLIDGLSTRHGRSHRWGKFEAVWPRQHRAVIPRTFIPAVLLARRIGREALLDRRLDPLAALAIWLVGHFGHSLLGLRTYPIAPDYWQHRPQSVSFLCH